MQRWHCEVPLSVSVRLPRRHGAAQARARVPENGVKCYLTNCRIIMISLSTGPIAPALCGMLFVINGLAA